MLKLMDYKKNIHNFMLTFFDFVNLLYFQVESISQKRTIAFLNHFVSHTAAFLNRFSCVCEEKLEHMSNRLQQLEITMNLLDAKVSKTVQC